MPKRPEIVARPEILPPEGKQLASQPIEARSSEVRRPGLRAVRGQDLFSDENLDRLSHLLDDCFQIPGTPIRFGLDGIIGFIPGIGDVLGGIASCILLVAGWVRGVPYVTLVRMVANVAIEVTLGAVPFLGNVFDIVWKANRRNYALLIRHIEQPQQHTWKDWTFLAVLATAIGAIVLAPLIVVIILLWHLRLNH